MIAMLVLWLCVSVLFLLGIVGTVVPGLPETGFVFVGILLYAVVTKFTDISIGWLVGFGIVSLASVILDYVGTAVGAKVGGGGRYTIIGGVLGAIVGLFFSPLGALFGAFLGALAGAFFEGLTSKKAFRAASYAVLGMALTGLAKCVLILAMVGTFFWLIWF